MRYLLSAPMLALCASLSLAAPPSFDPPAQIPITGGVALYSPPDDCVSVKYIELDGEAEFPVDLVGGKKTVFAFLTRGLPAGKTYRFVGVASSATGEQVEKPFAVVIPGDVPPPPKKPDPKDPPVPVPVGYYFLIVRVDGNASPAFTEAMKNPAWKTLEANGHKVTDRTFSEARKLGADRYIPAGGPLPYVVTLKEDPNTKTSKFIRGMPMPSDPLKLLEGL